MRRIRRALLTAVGTVLVFALSATGAVAAFNAITSNPGNSFGMAPDFARPVADRATITHSNGKEGHVKAGATYVAYGNVQADEGNPPSGIASVNTDLSTLGGSSATPLTTSTCPCTIGGQTYNYKTATLTVGAGIAEGSKTFSLTLTDNAANSGIDGGYTVNVDNTAPAVAAGAAGAVIQKSSGGKAGFLKASAPYYVYANPTDAGSGVSTVTANVASVTTGATAVALTTAGGPWTGIDGNTYTHRSTQQTANAGLTTGAKTFTLTGTDAVTNTATTSDYIVTADLAAPTLTRSVLAKTTGYSGSYLKPSGTYHVYAELADASSGVFSATANVADATTGQTALTMTTTGGPWTVEGQTYAWRSQSQLTANAGLTNGTGKTWSVTATDNADVVSGALAGTTFTGDNAAPTTVNTFTATNGTAVAGEGGVARRPDRNDKMTFVFNDQIDTGSLINGFGGMADGVAQNVLVQLNDNGTGTDNGGTTDSITIFDATTPTERVKLGTLRLGRDFLDWTVGKTKVFGTAAAPSTMVRVSGTPTEVRITLGANTTNYDRVLTGGVLPHTMAWTPLAGMYDRAGNALTDLATVNQILPATSF